MKKGTRKPFVVPQVKEQASLVGVTLISGGAQAQFRQRCFGSKKRTYSGHFHHHES